MDTTTASADTAMARDTTSVVADTTAADTLAASENQQAAGAQPTTPPPQTRADTPPARSPKPAAQAATGGSKVTQEEYEGWRQYSVNCARCHGQDVLPNPVAANLLVSLAPGGPIDTYEKFFQAVNEGRPERGMPAFKGLLSPDQTKSIHGYVKGRAEKRIPPGRPASPG
jgi:mono/diheme cytochrome c family protein